jgi:two-component system LytT family sensor kinase
MLMNGYDFLFSNQRSYRLRRHGLFWVAWCAYFLGTFLIPTYWVPGWNLRGPMPQIEQYGVWVSALRLLMNGVLMTLVHMALVYGILYYILPRYLSRKHHRLATTGLLVLYVALIAGLNYPNFLLIFSLSTSLGYFPQMPGHDFVVPVWWRHILFNYPTVLGFALAIKLSKNWYLKQRETAQLAREKTTAELQLLKAQVHPHFLFNTLNNIYSFILSDAPAAPALIRKLSGLLRFVIEECNQPLVRLDRELEMIRDYTTLEQIRYGDNFKMIITVEGMAEHKMICPTLILPFLENAFKHGTSRMLSHPWVRLHLAIGDETLQLQLANSKPDSGEGTALPGGLGLGNVKKRLALLYPGRHRLSIREDALSFEVFLEVPLFPLGATASETTVLTNTPAYERA